MNSNLVKILELVKKNQFNEVKKKCLILIENNCNDPEIFNIYAIACFQLEDYESAIDNWKKSIKLNPKYFFAFNNIGKALLFQKKFEEALENFNKTILIKPDFFEVYNNKGNTLVKLGRFEEAIQNYNKAIEIRPSELLSYIFKGHALAQIDSLEDALSCYQKAYNINSEYPLLFGYILNIKAQICDWKQFDQNLERLKLDIENEKKVTFPFTTLTLLNRPDLQKKASEIWADQYKVPNNKVNKFSIKKDYSKIKLGYFTADFRDHATSHLTAEMFENHNKSKFEIIGFYLGKKLKYKDAWHERLKKSFDQFFYVDEMSDQNISKLATDLKIDIAIDLMAHCTNGMQNRFSIFMRACAPIQINFLGYPGTSGSQLIDYIIADKITIPEESQKFFTEKVIYLPDTYQPNTKKIKKTNNKFSRSDFGLPNDKFVFCCFNQHQKISPKMFDIWMNILKKNHKSILWLLEDNIFSKKNLIMEAEKRKINKSRIVFSNRLPLEDHLERIKLADLFLDTFPYTAHTTCSDAIRSGLPVLTLEGETFASRVASSLLKIMDLDELVTKSINEYEKLANNLCNDLDALKKIKQKIQKNLTKSKLFNSKAYTENLEKGYIKANNDFIFNKIKKNIYL